MGSQKLMAMIGGVVVTLIALAFFGPLTGAANNLYLQFAEHCIIEGDPTLAVRNVATPENDRIVILPVQEYIGTAFAWGTNNNWGFADSQCIVQKSAIPNRWLLQASYTETPSVTQHGVFSDGTTWNVIPYQNGGTPAYLLVWQVYSEDGLIMGVATPLDGDSFVIPPALQTYPLAGGNSSGEWLQAREITKRFATINTLLISLMPLMLVISFLASAWGSLYSHAASGSDGGIKDAIAWETRTLVILMIAVYLAPIFLSFAEGAALVSSSGAYQTTKQFGAIINLIFTLMPLAFTLGILTIVVVRGVKTYKSVRGNM